jgi:hypothetical protein
MSSPEEKVSITVLLPAGRLPLDLMQKAHDLAAQYDLDIYLSTLQNLRLLNVPQSAAAEIKEALAWQISKPLQFPSRVWCRQTPLQPGMIDTRASERSARFANRKDQSQTEDRYRLISAAPGSEPATRFVAGRNGYDILPVARELAQGRK